MLLSYIYTLKYPSIDCKSLKKKKRNEKENFHDNKKKKKIIESI